MKKYLPKIIGTAINLISYFSPQYSAKLAILIFSSPKKGKLNENEADYLKSAIKEKVFYKDISIMTYRWSGKKDTILLAHGWESNSYRWKDLIELLKLENYNIVCIDAPAHGKSGSKIFNALLYSESINVVSKKFGVNIIIGHSIGGTASAISQHNYKLPIKKFVLLGAPSNFKGMVNNYIHMMCYNKRVSKAMDSYYLKHYNNTPDYFSVENFSENIQAKGLIIHDKKDKIIPFKDALEIKKYYRNAELIKTIGLGHGLKSDDVYKHILEFINQ